MARLSGNERAIVVTALKHAAPYIRMFKRKVFVLKAGGEAFVSRATTRALVEQIGVLHEVGIRVVLVHGGGPQSTRLARERGIPINIIDGRRITDEATLEVTATVFNEQINPMILEACRELSIPAVAICAPSVASFRSRVVVTLAPDFSAAAFALVMTGSGRSKPSGFRTTTSIPRIAAIWTVEDGTASGSARGW